VARLKPDTLTLTGVLALLTAIGPMATDMYLPVLPVIRTALDATTSQTQATLSGFLIGYALAQLFYGPISDRKGRRPAMLAGLALFTLGSILCALAQDIRFLVAARVLQALGGAGTVVLARAMVRDLYEGPRAGRELARMGSIMAVVPAVVPILGAGFAAIWGWRSIFWFMAIAGPALALIVAMGLPESLRAPLTTRFSLAAMLRDFGAIFRMPTFRTYTLTGGLTFAGFMAFLSGGSFVLQGVYRISDSAFALGFALVVVGYIIGTSFTQRKVGSWGIDKTIRCGTLVAAPAAAAMVLAVATGWGGALGVFIPMTVFQASMGLILPLSSAGAMMPFPEKAGSASSLFSVLQMSLAATSGALVGIALDHTPLALPVMILVCALAALTVFARHRPAGGQAPPASLAE